MKNFISLAFTYLLMSFLITVTVWCLCAGLRSDQFSTGFTSGMMHIFRDYLWLQDHAVSAEHSVIYTRMQKSDPYFSKEPLRGEDSKTFYLAWLLILVCIGLAKAVRFILQDNCNTGPPFLTRVRNGGRKRDISLMDLESAVEFFRKTGSRR